MAHKNFKSHHVPAAIVSISLVSVASAGERVRSSQEATEAFEAGDFARSRVLVSRELQACEANEPQADECLGLLFAATNLSIKTKDFAEAERLAQVALETAISVLGEQHLDTAKSYNNVAYSLNAQDRHAEAEPLYRKALEIWEELLGERHAATARGYKNLASSVNSQNRYAEAEPLYRKALEILQTVLGERHADTALSAHNLARNLDSQGRYKEAEPMYRRALEINLALVGEQHTNTAWIYSSLAGNLHAQGNYADAETLYRRALEIRRNLLGEQHAQTALSYSGLAYNFRAQANYEEAARLYRKALEIQQTVLGDRNPATATSYNNLGSVLQAQGHYQEADQAYHKALEIRQSVLGEWHLDTGTTYNNLAGSLDQQGRYEDAEPLLRKSLDILSAMPDQPHPNIGLSYNNLGSNLLAQGYYADAERLFRKSLQIHRDTLGERHRKTALSYNNVAISLNDQGRYEQAEALYRKALEIRLAVLGERHPETAESFGNVANNLASQGRYDEAEPLSRRALEIKLVALGEEHPDTALGYNNLAAHLDDTGRHADAEALYRRALEIRQAVLGEEHPDTAVSYNNLAMNLTEQGLHTDAGPLYRKAVEINLAVLGLRHPTTAVSHNNLAGNLNAVGRFDEADSLYRKALETNQAALGEQHPDTATSYDNLANNLSKQGRFDDAEQLYRKALEIRRSVLGEQHPDTARSLNNLGWFYADRGRTSEALSYSRRAVSIVRRQQALAQQARTTKLSGGRDNNTTNYIYVTFLKAAWLGFRDPDSADTADALMNEAFAAVQNLIANGTEAAVTQMAARFSTSDDLLSKLARKHQDTARELGATDNLILAAWGEGNQDKAENLRSRSGLLAEQLDALSEELRERYPAYAELVLPAPLSIVETQASLGEGQGLLLIAPWQDHTYVFAIAADSVQWQRVDLSWRELSRRAATLRCDVDPATCSDEATERTRAGASAYGESVSHGLRPFDRSTAYSIYRDILMPVMGVFDDVDALSVVISGPLSGIPLSVLVTEEPGAGEDGADPAVLRTTAWLGDRFALMSLPSVSSLESLGGINVSADVEREMFVGVGDPLLGGEQVADAGRGGLERYFRGVSEEGTALANPESLRQLAPLPGTRAELEAMARALGVPEDSLLLGEAATETAVKAESLSTEVLTFATHGLIAGELRGLGEPGLVLTPPEEATEHDDGILTASEVARLDMDVEWLILSACNTAAADGTPGAEGLSGLARAFLYAGARSLLVSHWRVRDDVTAQLTVAAIEGANDQSRSKSLQQAMRSIRTGIDENGDAIPGWESSWSHPAAWAPFSLVGASP